MNTCMRLRVLGSENKLERPIPVLGTARRDAKQPNYGF